jgi:amino-acid N-acetyltransferase
MQVERAGSSDTQAIKGLLTAAALPLDGAADAFGTGLVVRDGDAIVGAAAIEPYGDKGLLRSVVVASSRRGSGSAHASSRRRKRSRVSSASTSCTC